MYGDYVKVIGVKFDILNGLRVVADYNAMRAEKCPNKVRHSALFLTGP